jgi:hypothetical protein
MLQISFALWGGCGPSRFQKWFGLVLSKAILYASDLLWNFGLTIYSRWFCTVLKNLARNNLATQNRHKGYHPKKQLTNNLYWLLLNIGLF